MPAITLRQSNVRNSPNAIIKGSPLTNSEVDNNFANINLSITALENTTYVFTTFGRDVTFDANLKPRSNAVYDLGNVTNRIRDLYLSGNLVANIDGSISILDNSITGVKIANASIGTVEISDLAITENKIATAAVTETKLGSNSVSTAKIANLSVTENKIANGAITTTKLSNTGVVANTYGGSSSLVSITVTSDGRITNLSNINASFATTGKAIAMAIVFGG